MKKREITPNQVWREYENSKDYLEKYNYYSNTEDCWRFYQGDQWHGLEAPTGQEKPPILNFIKPAIKYKVGIVNSNGYSINYTPQGYYEEYEINSEICEILNKFASKEWERLKFDTKLWKHSTRAAVTGDSYAYFVYNEKTQQIDDAFIDNVSIHFADEQETDIQKQKYIILRERLLVSQIRKMAKENGAKDDELSLILADNDTDKQIGDRAKHEVKLEDDDGKTTLLTRLWKDDSGYVHILKSTEHVIVKPDTPILSFDGTRGLKNYPIAHLIWAEEYGGCRGQGDVLRLIDNQVEVNKTNARYSIILKQFAFPHLIYDKSALTSSDDVKALLRVGSTIGLDGNRITRINELINYLQPPAIPADSFNYSSNLMNATRELAGASDSVTGQINPEKASGLAIQAVQDAAALPLNEQQANLKQFVEDIARIWIDMWGAYFGSVSIAEESENGIIEAVADLSSLNYVIKVDISPANPYSKFSQEQTMLNLLSAGYINFEQYVDSLSDDSSAPKVKLQEIVNENRQLQEEQMQMQQMAEMEAQQVADQEMTQTDIALQELLAENAQLKEALQQLTGGING